MPSGLIDIATYGSQDLFLTGTPEITFFKTVYRRHTLFATESKDVPFNNQFGFGRISEIKFESIGDLINKMYLKIELPSIYVTRKLSADAVAQKYYELNVAIAEYQRALIFMNVNTDSYRGAIDVYNANNISVCYDMVYVIDKIFKSYYNPTQVNSRNSKNTTTGINDVSDVSSDIDWFMYNSPIESIVPYQFNLYSIALNYLAYVDSKDPNLDPQLVSKEDFKLIIDYAMSYSKSITLYYEKLVKQKNEEYLDVSNKNYKFAWIERLGHFIIDYIELYIGAERIDRYNGQFTDIWYELAGNKFQSINYMKMIGNVPELTNFDRIEKPKYILYIPLVFWLNKFNGLSLPLVALQYHDVTLRVKLKNFNECCYMENPTYYGDNNSNLYNIYMNGKLFVPENALNGSLLVDYVYLDSKERKKFAQSSHEYLIEQIQIISNENITSNQSNYSIELSFFHPTKELIWVVQKTAWTQNLNGFRKTRWNNYTTTKEGKGYSIEYAHMEINGESRMTKQLPVYFNYVQPYQHHKNSPSQGIYVYSYALQPEEQQPSGSCNFTRIDKYLLYLKISDDMFIYRETDYLNDYDPNIVHEDDSILSTNVNINIYARNTNILRIMSGIGSLTYI